MSQTSIGTEVFGDLFQALRPILIGLHDEGSASRSARHTLLMEIDPQDAQSAELLIQRLTEIASDQSNHWLILTTIHNLACHEQKIELCLESYEQLIKQCDVEIRSSTEGRHQKISQKCLFDNLCSFFCNENPKTNWASLSLGDAIRILMLITKLIQSYHSDTQEQVKVFLRNLPQALEQCEQFTAETSGREVLRTFHDILAQWVANRHTVTHTKQLTRTTELMEEALKTLSYTAIQLGDVQKTASAALEDWAAQGSN